MRRILLLPGTALFAVLSVACSSGSSKGSAADGGGGEVDACGTGGADGGACTPYVSCADLTTPDVSFATDILPILQPSCAIAGSTCHGTPDVATTQARPYLGNYDGGTDAAQVVTGLVGVTSNEDPSMPEVTASDPGSSFLMHKLDNDQCQFANDCKASKTQYTDCGQQMPYSSPPLEESQRDTIRRWIAQGAKNN
jgi:hypothetical protein